MSAGASLSENGTTPALTCRPQREAAGRDPARPDDGAGDPEGASRHPTKPGTGPGASPVECPQVGPPRPRSWRRATNVPLDVALPTYCKRLEAAVQWQFRPPRPTRRAPYPGA